MASSASTQRVDQPSADIAESNRLRATSLQTARAVARYKKPKVRKLQMDWLRSEDLKEEKNVTAPIAIVASDEPVVAQERRGVPLGMHRKNPECFDADSSDRSEAADLLFREEPDEEEDEEEEDGEEKDDDGDEGYSE